MGLKDDVINKAEEIVIGLVVDEIVDGARWLANKLLGNQADDGVRDAVARGAIEGAAAAARAKLAELEAAKNLDDFARQVLGAVAAIDVDAIFRPKPHGHAGPQEVEILEPNRDGKYRTAAEELADAKAESKAIDERLARERAEKEGK